MMVVTVPKEKQIIKQKFYLATLILLFDIFLREIKKTESKYDKMLTVANLA